MVIDFCSGSNGTSQSQGGCPNYSEGWSVPPEILVGVAMPSAGSSVADLVEDIVALQDNLYFVVDSVASSNHWSPQPDRGICRGPLHRWPSS